MESLYDNLHTKLLELMKTAYDQGWEDGVDGSICFEDGFDIDASQLIKDALNDSGIFEG